VLRRLPALYVVASAAIADVIDGKATVEQALQTLMSGEPTMG